MMKLLVLFIQPTNRRVSPVDRRPFPMQLHPYTQQAVLQRQKCMSRRYSLFAWFGKATVTFEPMMRFLNLSEFLMF